MEVARRMQSTPGVQGALARIRSTRRAQRRVATRWRYRRLMSHHRARALPVDVEAGPGWVHRRSTLLELVQAVQEEATSDTDVVTIIRWLVNSGTVILTGSFAGQRIEDIG